MDSHFRERLISQNDPQRIHEQTRSDKGGKSRSRRKYQIPVRSRAEAHAGTAFFESNFQPERIARRDFDNRVSRSPDKRVQKKARKAVMPSAPISPRRAIAHLLTNRVRPQNSRLVFFASPFASSRSIRSHSAAASSGLAWLLAKASISALLSASAWTQIFRSVTRSSANLMLTT